MCFVCLKLQRSEYIYALYTFFTVFELGSAKNILKLKYLRNIILFLTRILDEAQEYLTTRMCTDSSKKNHTDCNEAPLQYRRKFSCRVLTGSVLLAILLVYVYDEGLYPLGVANYPVLEGGILRHARITVNSRPYQETWMRTWWVRGGPAGDSVTPGCCRQLCASALPPSSCFVNSATLLTLILLSVLLLMSVLFLIFPPRLFMIFHTSSFFLFFQIPLFYLNWVFFKRNHMRCRYV